METLTCPVCHLPTPTLPDGQIAAHTAGGPQIADLWTERQPPEPSAT